jgi:hypothetical protein
VEPHTSPASNYASRLDPTRIATRVGQGWLLLVLLAPKLDYPLSDAAFQRYGRRLADPHTAP